MSKTVVIYPHKNKKGSDSKRKERRNLKARKEKVEAATLQAIERGVYDDFLANRIVNNTQVLYPKKEAETFTPKIERDKAMVLAAGLLFDFRNPEKVEENLSRLQQEKKSYDKTDLSKAFGIPETEYADDFTSVYKRDHLYKFHDAVRVDGSYSNAVEKSIDFVMGVDYSHIVADVNTSFPSSNVESKELTKINNNYVIFSIKNELEEIDRTVELRKVIISHMINRRTYGRACNLVTYDETTKLPSAINPLSSIGLGRVFYKKTGWKVLGLEYEYEDPPNQLLASSQIIYSTNRDYGQSPGSYRYGYSDVEYFQHLVETDFIINAFDLKEINRNNYLPKKIYRVLTEDPRVVTEIRKAIELGNQVVTRHQVDVKDVTSASESQTLIDQRTANDDKITQETGLPNILMGKKTSDTQSIATQVMQMFNQTTARKWRMEIREVFEPQYYNRNIKQIVKNRLDFLNKIKSKYADGKRNSDTILQEMLRFTQQDELTEGEVEELGYLRYEYLLQKDREKWDAYRGEYFNERLKVVESLVNDNVSIPFDQNQAVFDKIKNTVTKNSSFDVNTLDSADSTETPEPDPSLKPESQWKDFNIPSPSTIDFEIAELEKLLPLEPEQYDWKIKMVFTSASLITDLEKATMVSGLVRDGIIPKEYGLKIMEYEDLIESEKMKEELQKTVDRLSKKFGMSMSPEQAQAQNMPMMDVNDGTVIQGGKMQNNLGNNFDRQRNKSPRVQTDQTSTP